MLKSQPNIFKSRLPSLIQHNVRKPIRQSSPKSRRRWPTLPLFFTKRYPIANLQAATFRKANPFSRLVAFQKLLQQRQRWLIQLRLLTRKRRYVYLLAVRSRNLTDNLSKIHTSWDLLLAKAAVSGSSSVKRETITSSPKRHPFSPTSVPAFRGQRWLYHQRACRKMTGLLAMTTPRNLILTSTACMTRIWRSSPPNARRSSM
jgi:hypothetical protein